MPLVSIIIPVYNLEDYIGRCLESCLNQTYKDFEVIVVNDGSTDGSVDVIKEFIEQDNRVRLINVPNGGASEARRTGLKFAIGKWIMFVDGDDYIDSTIIDSLLDATKQGSKITICNIALEKKHKIVYLKSSLPTQINKLSIAQFLLNRRVSFSLSAKLFNKELFRSITLESDLKIGEDAYWTTQLLLQSTPNISIINKSLYHYLERENSILHKPSRTAVYSRLGFIVLMKNLLENELKHQFIDITQDFNRFCCDEYYGFLLMNGDWNDIRYDAKPVFKKYLHDIHSSNLIENFIVWSYVYSPFVGKITICLLNQLKKLKMRVASL